MRVAVLIPAFRPAAALLEVVGSLSQSGVEAILVVDDGSGPEFAPIFEKVAQFPKVYVLRHAVNLGKGAALRTGLNYALCELPQCIGVVTADADGQHQPADILSVARALVDKPDHLVLGARLFDGPVPLRSRFGNSVTRAAFRFLVGQNLLDTQTGLRGIPRAMMPHLLKIAAPGYEFELDMLITAKHNGWPLWEQPIRTIYEPGNKSSHFNPLLDSLRTYAVLLRFVMVSLATALLDNAVFYVAYTDAHNIAASQVAARAVAIAFQYAASRRAVFLSRGRHDILFPRFLLLAATHGVVSYIMIRGLVDAGGLSVILAKPLAEGLLFIASFLIQRELVFTRSAEPEPAGEAPEDTRTGPAPSPGAPSVRYRAVAWLVYGGALLVSVWGLYSGGLLKQDLWSHVGWHRLKVLTLWYTVWAAFWALAPAWFAPVTAVVLLGAFAAAFGPMAVAAVLWFLFSCLVTGALLLPHDEEPGAASRLLQLLLGVAVWMSLIGIAAHFRVNYTAAYLIALSLPLAVRPGTARSCLAACGRLLRPVRPPGGAGYAALALAAFPLICHFLVVAKPEVGADALAVHLMVPSWIGFQHYWPFDFHHFAWAVMPLGVDWCYTAVFLPGGEFAARLLNFAFLALLVGLVCAASRRWLPFAPALLVAGLFASTPLVQLVTGSLFAENLWAAFVLAAVLALERYHATGAPRWLCLAGALFGAGLATKLGTIAFLLPAAGFAAWELIARRRALARSAAAAAGALGLLLLFGAPAYLFAWAKTGNPVFPFLNGVFKSPWFDTSAHTIDLRFHTPLNVFTPFDVVFHSHRYLESRDGALGFQYLLLVPLALLALTRKRPYPAWFFLAMALIPSLIVFHTMAYLPYVYPALPLLMIASAIALEQFRTGGRLLFRGVLAGLLAAFLLNIYFLPSSGWWHAGFFLNPFKQREVTKTLVDMVPVRGLIEYLNKEHPGAPVALFETGVIAGLRAESYKLGWHDWQYSQQVWALRDAAAYGRLAQSLGIKYFIAPREGSGMSVSPPAAAAFLAQCTEPEYRVGQYELRRLKQPQFTAPNPSARNRTLTYTRGRTTCPGRH
jgi:glycosyltransferase involved in cell wall biosynthesis